MKIRALPPSSRRVLKVVWTLALCFFAFACIYFYTNIPVSVTFVDVGQGDSALIQAGKNGNVLIDGGDDGSGVILQSFLSKQNVRSLNAVFVSHFHDDHIQGIMELILGGYPIKMLYLPKYSYASESENTLLDLLNEKQIPFRRLEENEVLTIGKATYHLLWPKQKAAYMKENNQSLVLRMDYGENRILFTGDIEASAQAELFATSPEEIQAQVLKVPHHGGKTAVFTPFLKACAPQISVIGVGIDNYHGHPSKEMLNALTSLKSLTYRTDYHGNVKLILDKTSIKRIETSIDKWRILH